MSENSTQVVTQRETERFGYLERINDSLVLRSAPLDGYVYVLRSGPYFKIGRTKDLDRRIPTLAIQLPFPAVVIKTIPSDNAIAAEAMLHERFIHARVNGEWFVLDEADREEALGVGGFVRGREIRSGFMV